MAIEGFGESLLGEKRARDTKRKKKQQTYDALGAAATIGVGMYRNSLKEKQEDFFKSEQVMAEKAVRSSADRTADSFFKTESNIEAYGPGERVNYFIPEYVDILKRKMLEADPTQRRAIELGVHDDRLRKDALPLARPRLAAHDEGLRLAAKYSASPTMATELEVANKQPKTVAGSVFNIFKGKKSEDLERETLQAYRESKGADLARQVDLQEDAYNDTRSLLIAHTYANQDITYTEEQAQPFIDLKIERDVSFIVGNDGVKREGYTRKVTKYNEIEDKTTVIGEQFVPYLNEDELKKDKDTVHLRSLNKSFNIYSEVKTALSEPSQKAWKDTATLNLSKAGVSAEQIKMELYMPSTLANYQILTSSFNELSFTDEDFNNKLDVRTINEITKAMANNPIIMERISNHQKLLETKYRSLPAGTSIDKQWLEDWQLVADEIAGSVRLRRRATSLDMPLSQI
jgi:hypothetical protein